MSTAVQFRGVDAPLSDDPADFGAGISIGTISGTASGWPTTYATMLTVKDADCRGFQVVGAKSTSDLFVRSMNCADMQPFRQVMFTDMGSDYLTAYTNARDAA